MSEGKLQDPLIQKKVETLPDGVVQTSQTEPKSIGFFQMFRFADTTDFSLMWFGAIAALASGTIMPLFSFLFGNVALIYVNPDPVGESLKIAIKFWALAAASWVLNFSSIYCWTMAGERQSLRYRKIYYRLLLRQEVHWYDMTNPNELATRVTTQITAIQGAIGEKIATIFTVSVMSTLGFFLAYYRNWRLSLVLSVTLPLLMLAGFLLMKAMQKLGQKNTKIYADAGATAQQAIGAIRTVKSLVGESYEINKYVTQLQKTLKISNKYTLFMAMSVGFMIMMFLSSYGLGFWYGKIIILDYGYTVADVISTFFCIIMGGGSIGQITPALKNIALGKAALAKMFELIDRKPTLKEPTNGTVIDRINSISFKSVEFAYPKNPDVKVIKQLDITIPSNKTTAIVGESGSGKSTIVQLVQRFYDPTAGEVLINGHPLTQLDMQNYRKQIGYVGQQPAMFSMSIRENLLFAKQNATDQEMEDALRQANALQFVNKMENKLDTFLGAGGAQISGGQKQRIAIARGILKNPSMFVFDEATSALDRKNEKLIQQTLNQLSKNRTTLVIAHRLSTIRRADNIIVLNGGRIVEQGRHEDLVQAKSYYYDLVKNQIQANEEVPEDLGDNEEKLEVKQSVAGQQQQQAVAQSQQAKQKREGAVFSKLLVESSDKKFNFVFGSLCALINGLTFPAFSYILSNLMGIMSKLNNPTFPNEQEQIKKDIDMYCIGFGLAALVGGLTTAAYQSAFGAVGDSIVYKLRFKAFSKLMRMPISYFDKKQNNPGSVSTKLAQDAYLVHNMITGVLSVIILNLSTLTAGLTLAFYYNWRLTLIVIGLGPLLAIAGSLNMKRMKQFASQADKAYTEAGNQISDTVCNIRTVKSFGNTTGLVRTFNKKLQSPYKIAVKKAFTSGFFQGLSQAITLVVYGLVFYLAAVLSQNVQHTNPQNIFISIFAIVFAAVGLGNNFSMMPDLAKAKVAGANLFEIIESEDEYQLAVASGGINQQPISGTIEFRDVSFKYPSREKAVFKSLTFNITAGQKIGLVGSSGCGKSTILQLVLRFYDADGLILIDGRNIKDYDLYHLRQAFGIVTQQPVLFAGSIQENIKYKLLNATLEQVKEAASVANASKFIQAHEQGNIEDNLGYDREVGTKGIQISGGQKQRLAIARCVLSNPQVFFLDEATSALDVETEKAVFESLNKISRGKTSISIAHRLSTIIDANKIIVFHEGKIIEEGTYEELTEQKGYFYRLERGQN